MKNYLNSLLYIVAVALIMASCEEEPLVYTPDNTYAQLSSETAVNVGESGSPVTVKVQLGTIENTQGATFDFTITGDATRYTVTPTDGKITFDAGKYEANIVITPTNNNVADGNAVLTVSLQGTNIGAGGDSVNLVSKKITIVDDDCPITIDDTETWIAQYDYTSSTRGLMPASEIQLQKVSDNQWYLPTTWGLNGVAWLTGAAAYEGLYVFDAVITLNDDLTCLIEGTSGLTPGGDEGTYDPCTNTFSFSKLNDELFSGGGLDRGFTLTGK